MAHAARALCTLQRRGREVVCISDAHGSHDAAALMQAATPQSSVVPELLRTRCVLVARAAGWFCRAASATASFYHRNDFFFLLRLALLMQAGALLARAGSTAAAVNNERRGRRFPLL